MQPFWYPGTDDCNEIIDFNAQVWEYGGCYYDLSVGACHQAKVQATSVGCAAGFEQYMAQKVSVMN